MYRARKSDQKATRPKLVFGPDLTAGEDSMEYPVLCQNSALLK